MGSAASNTGVVYTETMVYSPPEQYAADAPYQLAIVDLDTGERKTVRILDDRVGVGDRVGFVEERNGVFFYRRIAS